MKTTRTIVLKKFDFVMTIVEKHYKKKYLKKSNKKNNL